VLLGATFWALYTVLIRWRPTRLPLALFLAVTIAFGVLFHLPLLAVELPATGRLQLNTGSLASIVYFAVFPSILAYLFWNRVVQELGPAQTGYFMYLLPVFSTLLGMIILDEPFGFFHSAGIICIFLGLGLITAEKPRETVGGARVHG
jgi:drug/metabolite transporter (DMT)-like permease